MQECFESQDIGMLQQVIKELPEEEARFVHNSLRRNLRGFLYLLAGIT